MDNETNSPNKPVVETAHLRFDVEELGSKENRWRLEVRPGDLALFQGEDLQPFVLVREQFQKDCMLIENVRVLVLKQPRKLNLKLSTDAATAVAEWLGKPFLAHFYLRRRYAWILPAAVMWMIGSLPIPGNPQVGVDAKPLDLIALAMGLVLVIAWAFAKWRPNPVLFLVDSFWFLCLAGYLINDVLHGRSKLWLVFVAFALTLVVSGIKHFSRFRGTRIAQV